MKTIILKISGMHCTSCSLNLDLDLEETPGVISAKTHFAKSVSEISYDPQKITPKQIIEVVKKAGYGAN